MNIINIHLGLGEEERDIQLKELNSFISELGSDYYIVVGDFNEGGIEFEEEILKDAAKELKKSNVLTFATGLDRIDYIFTSAEIEILEYNVLIKTMSDRYPIVAKIKI